MAEGALYPVALLLLLCRVSYGLIVPWKTCPEISMGDTSDYDCDLWKHMWRLVPLAHIPGGASSMTLFHNPYHSLNCIYFDFYCRKDTTILGDLYLTPKGKESLVCPGFIITLEENRWHMELLTNPASKVCQTVDRWLTLDIFAYRQNEYIFVYGCRQRGENLPVVIGAWILGDINATEEQRTGILQDTRKLAMKIPGFRDDWWFYPDGVERCRSNDSCDYLANCLISPDVQEIHVPVQDSALSTYVVLVPIAIGLAILCCYAVYKSLRGIKVSPA